MSLATDFNDFCKKIILDNLLSMETSAGEIAKKLNKVYYNLEKDNSSHLYIVGSVGRNTAIKNSSDLDIIFDLPNNVYTQYDNYTSNGQSALLQDVKKVLLERYPNTKISGDGQVVVIELTNYTVELVPAFKQSDDRFKYPDTHDGGSWKYTDPLAEQAECSLCENESNNKYFDFCHILRAWKNQVGFCFGGLLIDTLVYNHFVEKEYFKNETDYFVIFKSVLCYFKSRNKEQSYWLAVGSNQQVSNTDNGIFVTKAKKAYSKIKDAEDNNENLNDVLRDLLGTDFPESTENTISNAYELSSYYNKRHFRDTEQFVEKIFRIDVRYSLELECVVSQDGWRDMLLSVMLRDRTLLRTNKRLDFYVKSTNCPAPYDIYWKVRNVGAVAEEKDCIRGDIKKTNNIHHKEHTDFRGEHFVECYFVRNGVCIARGHIDVPIHT